MRISHLEINNIGAKIIIDNHKQLNTIFKKWIKLEKILLQRDNKSMKNKPKNVKFKEKKVIENDLFI